MDPKPTNEESEARASSNMADAGASGEDASSASPASTGGVSVGRWGAVGHPPLWLRLARTRSGAKRIAKHTGYGRAISAMEAESDVAADGIRDVDGSWISAGELLGTERRRGKRVRRNRAGKHYLNSDLSDARDKEKLADFGRPRKGGFRHGYSVVDPGHEATGFDNGRPATLINDPHEIERLFRKVWDAAWLAADLYAPGDDELKKKIWLFATACVLVHGNVNLRNEAPLMARRSYSTWWRLSKRMEELLAQLPEIHRMPLSLPLSGQRFSDLAQP